jgi:hypothetical protein
MYYSKKHVSHPSLPPYNAIAATTPAITINPPTLNPLAAPVNTGGVNPVFDGVALTPVPTLIVPLSALPYAGALGLPDTTGPAGLLTTGFATDEYATALDVAK